VDVVDPPLALGPAVPGPTARPLGPRLWRPRFLISVINVNVRISQVKPADVGQT
jgi:hypothetical protein